MISCKTISVQWFVSSSKPAAFLGVLGIIILRDCAMIPLRPGFPLVWIAGSLESNWPVYCLALLNIFADPHMDEYNVDTIYKGYLCSPWSTCCTLWTIPFRRTGKLFFDHVFSHARCIRNYAYVIIDYSRSDRWSKIITNNFGDCTRTFVLQGPHTHLGYQMSLV